MFVSFDKCRYPGLLVSVHPANYLKTIGLIGGTSWVSTAEYYKIINERTNECLGGLNSAKILLYSVNIVQSFK